MSIESVTSVEATPTASLVWFEVPAEDVDRAKNFYSGLFGWKIGKVPGPMEFWHIDTGGPDATPDGGLLKRQSPEHRGITQYISVQSLDESVAKVQRLGGHVRMGKTPVPQMGYFAICQDTEGNSFGLWEHNSNAK
jgi:uncharacterized protein